VTPYYQQGGITIYHGDALDLLPDLPLSATMILDPAFFMPAQHYAARSEWPRSWADTSILARWWALFLDVVRPRLMATGNVFVFCDDESYPVFYPPLYVRFAALSALVWDKGRIGMGNPWRHTHEFVIHGRALESSWYGSKGESDILRFTPTPRSERRHPVSKPRGLLMKLIGLTTQPGDLVVDPFMGGGSTLDAAAALGRRVIGIDLEERYCAEAVERLRQQPLPMLRDVAVT
jgi:site-specific DNA-methyltransferase (adenine-specific)